MRAYCPHSPLVSTGWIEGWRLTFAGEDPLGYEGAVCTIVESETEGDRVFVALYDVHPQDEQLLDEVEGAIAGTYRKLHVRVITLDGEVTSWVYVFAGYQGGLPTAWCRDRGRCAQGGRAGRLRRAAARGRPRPPSRRPGPWGHPVAAASRAATSSRSAGVRLARPDRRSVSRGVGVRVAAQRGSRAGNGGCQPGVSASASPSGPAMTSSRVTSRRPARPAAGRRPAAPRQMDQHGRPGAGVAVGIGAAGRLRRAAVDHQLCDHPGQRDHGQFSQGARCSSPSARTRPAGTRPPRSGRPCGPLHRPARRPCDPPSTAPSSATRRHRHPPPARERQPDSSSCRARRRVRAAVPGGVELRHRSLRECGGELGVHTGQCAPPRRRGNGRHAVTMRADCYISVDVEADSPFRPVLDDLVPGGGRRHRTPRIYGDDPTATTFGSCARSATTSTRRWRSRPGPSALVATAIRPRRWPSSRPGVVAGTAGRWWSATRPATTGCSCTGT